MAKLIGVDWIVVHCSDTPNGRDHTAAEICQWHRDKGWSQIGYHDVIRPGGILEMGREEDNPGAHVRGYNSRSVGICLIGRDRFDEHQMNMLYSRVLTYKTRWHEASVVGHTDLDPSKTCPNFDVRKWWADKQSRSWG